MLPWMGTLSGMRRLNRTPSGAAACLAALIAAALTVWTPAASAALRHHVPGTTCAVFPADNVWNTDISKLPVDPRSDAWKRSMHAGSTDLHPDFGPPGYGMPFIVTSALPCAT